MKMEKNSIDFAHFFYLLIKYDVVIKNSTFIQTFVWLVLKRIIIGF